MVAHAYPSQKVIVPEVKFDGILTVILSAIARPAVVAVAVVPVKIVSPATNVSIILITEHA